MLEKIRKKDILAIDQLQEGYLAKYNRDVAAVSMSIYSPFYRDFEDKIKDRMEEKEN